MAREWKRARAQDILVDSDNEGNEGSDDHYSDPYEDEFSEGESHQGKQFSSAPTNAAQPEVLGTDTACDTNELPLFDLDNLSPQGA
ncbi:Hypothetical predicted protein [Pelobates cultripes]|uniref:Uncharacterized protein n=1 Tax=Pelobates cultripes TaxID=61616 RepID=A0AAD1R2E7_PELCU|nr:Hypothetical predicted protein [Pelobates cultripes]